ncbi:MAG: thioredoxin domain-containing protein [Nitrospira sp.]|nr:thioredoxin domain-containing protein [Nitrospira sp.]MDH4302845.1 thioredoxin domain-containing protein [Nitrospira sp.]MDH5195155.1 thioredoxin domain-containing protein [Nitrospira sp.]
MRNLSLAGMVAGIVGLSILLFMAPPFSLTGPSGETPDSEAKTRVVATVGTRTIMMSEVEQAVALPLYQLDERRTKLLNDSIQRLIDEELLAAEAARRGIAVPDLIANARESEAITKLAGLPGPVRQATHPSQKEALALSLQTPEETARIRQALLVQLRRKTAIQVNLPQAALPLLEVRADDDPWTGTDHAPVTIIEFSDFECPYCRRSVPTLKELLDKYPGKLKLVYRDFPGLNHPQALSAAEAAQCAAEQNRFWDYHDALFSRQRSEDAWDFSNLAETLGLSPEPFTSCMNNHRYRAEVLSDLQDGLKLGVTSTPTFFINGRPLVGARPLADFQAIIEPLLTNPSSPYPHL